MPLRKHREGGDITAIFVHAGAGFHSFGNEKHHLSACQDAARVAMTILKNGGTAVDAVEMAIRVLEDREITNSGYGSNLSMDGTVECDATLVDHLGRSGAVGAVPEVKNPIGLARVILDDSSKPLSLARVPPNLLVGRGATEYAAEKGLTTLANEYLVSSGSRDRWLRWKQDLKIATEKEMHDSQHAAAMHAKYDAIDYAASTPLAFSPPTSPTPLAESPNPITSLPNHARPLVASAADLVQHTYLETGNTFQESPFHFSRTFTSTAPHEGLTEWQDSDVGSDHDVAMNDRTEWPSKRPRIDGSYDNSALPLGRLESLHMSQYSGDGEPERRSEDHITDTVGAIAVDCFGNLAAGSSSGGIGMKHRGRMGPAALVGIGTAVIPVDPLDKERVCVATVTSGTGEHMATTMAAATCAERIYSGVRKVPGGGLATCNEDEAMKNMIQEEFMNHPGVKNSHCAGAIGIMAVKKTKDGVFLYFGHNTDSFALASMHSEEKKAVCTMSRSTRNGLIAQGGRAAKFRKHH